MDLDNAIELIISLAKNGKKDMYNKLSRQSLVELKEYSEKEIVHSLQKFFTDLYHWYTDNKIKETNGYVEAYFQNSQTKETVKVIFTKEQGEWKIVWNANNFLDYR